MSLSRKELDRDGKRNNAALLSMAGRREKITALPPAVRPVPTVSRGERLSRSVTAGQKRKQKSA